MTRRFLFTVWASAPAAIAAANAPSIAPTGTWTPYATAGEIIRSSLVNIDALDVGEMPNSAEMAEGLFRLNLRLAEVGLPVVAAPSDRIRMTHARWLLDRLAGDLWPIVAARERHA